MLHARFEDTFAACSTMVVLVLLKTDLLSPWHMYLLNAVNGLMNTVQRPASDVAMTLIVPQKHYQRSCVLFPIACNDSSPRICYSPLCTGGNRGGNLYGSVTFAIAFLSLCFMVPIPRIANEETEKKESMWESVKAWLRH